MDRYCRLAVDRLPGGVQVGDPITDSNVLGNLGSKTKAAAFFAITYTFLGGKEQFEKPFKSGDGSAGQPETSTGSAAEVPEAVAPVPRSKESADVEDATHSLSNGKLAISGKLTCKAA